MNKVTVKIHDKYRNKFIPVEGVPVRIGVIEDLFVATPRALNTTPITFSEFCWDITHIPTGAAVHVGEETPEKAARAAELRILKCGMEKYITNVSRLVAERSTA